MPHLVSFGLVGVHLLNQHEPQPLFFFPLLPTAFELCHAHLGLDIFVIFFVVFTAIGADRTLRATTGPASTTGNGRGPAPCNAWCSFLLSSLAGLFGFAFPTTLARNARGC